MHIPIYDKAEFYGMSKPTSMMLVKMPVREKINEVARAHYPNVEDEDERRMRFISDRIDAFLRNIRTSRLETYKKNPNNPPLAEGDVIQWLPDLGGELDDTGVREKTIVRNHPFLLPYYLLLKNMMREYKGGLYVIDPKGIYLPIEEGLFGVCHLVRIPRRKQNIYALTDFRNSAVYRDPTNPLLTVIFQGVRETISHGFRFIDDTFFIIPISAMKPLIELEYSHEIIEDKDNVDPESIGELPEEEDDIGEVVEQDDDW